MSDAPNDFLFERTFRCPLCRENVPAKKPDEDRSIYVLEKHGGCGSFAVAKVRAMTLERFGDERERERLKRWVQAQNAKDVVPTI